MISDTYQPKEVETKLYKFWEEKGYFKPDSNPKKNCLIVL